MNIYLYIHINHNHNKNSKIILIKNDKLDISIHYIERISQMN